MLLPDWTVFRLTKEDVTLNCEVKRQCATYLSIVLQPSTMDVPVNFRMTYGDALCLLEDDSEEGRTLGGRQIRQETVDLELIDHWISSCNRLHDTLCAPMYTVDLPYIRLVDVETRRVVSHPGQQCQYVTLSYVWRNVIQRSYSLGESLESIPQTL